MLNHLFSFIFNTRNTILTVMFNHKRIFKLQSSEGALFEVEEATALQSQTIKHIIEDGCANNNIPLPNVNAATLAKVIEYCNKHADPTKEGDDELKKWDANFAKVDKDVLYDLIMAANYLDIKGLLDLLSQTVADIVMGRTPEQIRKYFNINNDFTQEEEEKVWNESAWAFQDP